VVGGALLAWRRSRIGALPLTLAPFAAVDDRGPPTVTVRAWLGRGRRIDGLEVRVRLRSVNGTEHDLPVLVGPAPVVGRFQAVARGLPEGWESGEVIVRVEAREGGRCWHAEQNYGPEHRRVGAFVAGITRNGRSVVWSHADWPRVVPFDVG
jgi:hypothetical protein